MLDAPFLSFMVPAGKHATGRAFSKSSRSLPCGQARPSCDFSTFNYRAQKCYLLRSLPSFEFESQPTLRTKSRTRATFFGRLMASYLYSGRLVVSKKVRKPRKRVISSLSMTCNLFRHGLMPRGLTSPHPPPEMHATFASFTPWPVCACDYPFLKLNTFPYVSEAHASLCLALYVGKSQTNSRFIALGHVLAVGF